MNTKPNNTYNLPMVALGNNNVQEEEVDSALP